MAKKNVIDKGSPIIDTVQVTRAQFDEWGHRPWDEVLEAADANGCQKKINTRDLDCPPGTALIREGWNGNTTLLKQNW